jgi:hypothetical protein
MAQSAAVLTHAAHRKDAAILNERAPCDACSQRARCAELNLACEAYAAYHRGAGKVRWFKAPRAPTASIYRMLFAPSNEALLRRVQKRQF